jgi:uncharacterized protein YfaP (DUF2135 family)
MSLLAALTVTLLWDTAVDLDLYVTDPAQETVYYANPRSRSGGALERDTRCAGRAAGEQVERARWTDPPPGRYRVGVDFPEGCDEKGPGEVPYRLVIESNGQREEVRGRAKLAEREARSFEFTLPRPQEGSR